MKFHRLTPEVPGDLGNQTRIDPSTHPPLVEMFHLDSINWGGDDLVECFPCYAVTPRLADALRASQFTGFRLDAMVTTLGVPGDEDKGTARRTG